METRFLLMRSPPSHWIANDEGVMMLWVCDGSKLVVSKGVNGLD